MATPSLDTVLPELLPGIVDHLDFIDLLAAYDSASNVRAHCDQHDLIRQRAEEKTNLDLSHVDEATIRDFGRVLPCREERYLYDGKVHSQGQPLTEGEEETPCLVSVVGPASECMLLLHEGTVAWGQRGQVAERFQRLAVPEPIIKIVRVENLYLLLTASGTVYESYDGNPPMPSPVTSVRNIESNNEDAVVFVYDTQLTIRQRIWLNITQEVPLPGPVKALYCNDYSVVALVGETLHLIPFLTDRHHTAQKTVDLSSAIPAWDRILSISSSWLDPITWSPAAAVTYIVGGERKTTLVPL